MSAHLYAIDTVPDGELDDWLEDQEDRLAEMRRAKHDRDQRLRDDIGDRQYNERRGQ